MNPRAADQSFIPGSQGFEQLLTDLYNACDPNKPATREYYADLSAARGSVGLVDEFLRRLRRTRPGAYQRCLFSGHIGGGKSSELLHLSDLLQDSSTDALRKVGGRRFFPVYLDTDEYLNSDDAGLPDLLLAIVAEIGVALKKAPLNIELADTYLVELLRRAHEGLFSEWSVEKMEIGASAKLASLKTIISPLKRDSAARVDVRRALTTHVENLLAAINLVLEKARLCLKQHRYPAGEPPYDDIVLIVDSLDRIRRFGSETDAEKASYDLFVRNAPTLTALNAHTTYTVPLRALYAFPGDLQSAYGMAPFTMPMVAVERRDEPGQEYPKGLACLKRMLEQRTEGQSVERLFDKEALDWLLVMSGGHVRNLMIFAQSAFSQTDALPIDLATAKRATAPTLQMYSRSIHESYFPVMAALQRSERRIIDTSEPDERAMLEQLMVLEYRNGSEQLDDLAEPWYAVNPIVRLLSGFKDALTVYDKEQIAKQATPSGSGPSGV